MLCLSRRLKSDQPNAVRLARRLFHYIPPPFPFNSRGSKATLPLLRGRSRIRCWRLAAGHRRGQRDAKSSRGAQELTGSPGSHQLALQWQGLCGLAGFGGDAWRGEAAVNPAWLLLPHRQHAGALPCHLFCNFRDVSDFLESKTSWLTDGHLFRGLGTGPGWGGSGVVGPLSPTSSSLLGVVLSPPTLQLIRVTPFLQTPQACGEGSQSPAALPSENFSISYLNAGSVERWGE